MYKNFIHHADMLAIPCFLLASLYFYKKDKRNLVENFLLIFTSIGFVLDLYFTIKFLCL